MTVNFSRRKIIQFLAIIALILILIHIIILAIYFDIANPDKFDFVPMFDLDMEDNLPTLFSTLLMFISAFLFYGLSKISIKEKKTDRPFWLGLSLIFTFLAFDENLQIHESIGDLTEQFIHTSGYLYYPWVISYSILVLILGLFYIRFFWRMEKTISRYFITSAIIFLSGAIGFELLGAHEASVHSDDTLLYCIYYTIEESLEMFGVIYLIWILLGLISKNTIKINA